MSFGSGYDSILLDKSDRSLITVDRIVRRRLAQGYPESWTPPDEVELGNEKEAHLLLDLYLTLYLANHGESPKSLVVLRRIYQESHTSQIRARAAQFLCQGLLTHNLDSRQDGQGDATDRSERECRSLCERALLEFEGFAWSRVVTHEFHAALGILDYYSGDRLSSKFHLSRALEQHSRLRSRYDKNTWTIALVYYYSGVLANEINDAENAVRLLTIAAKAVPPVMKITALIQLASALLKIGDPKGAKKAARRALRSPQLQEVGKGLGSELKGWLAEASLELGEKERAAKLFHEIIESGNAPNWEARARQKLREIDEKK